MEHKIKTFTFTTKIKGKDAACRVSTRKYTFEIEEVLVKRFGKEKLDKIFADQSIDFNFSLKDVEEDFPKLLQFEVDGATSKVSSKRGANLGGFSSIDFKTQDFDELLKVYAFFLLYKKNATLRELEFNNETLALAIEQARTVLASMPQLFSQPKS
ncbi:TPA: hypothetical protein DD449_02640 [Candidatus Berkelbacteria bacterium]|nr:hypothetical protein [Candidatus Berkelbacteria bacterium]